MLFQVRARNSGVSVVQAYLSTLPNKLHILYFFSYKMEFFSLPKQSQRSRSILQDGSRFLGLFRKGKNGIKAKFHRTDLVI